MRQVLSVGLVVLAGVLLGAAPQDTRPTISVETNLVMLPVTVVDPRGRLVAGLLREHFAVYDNGERRPIDFFIGADTPATIGLVIDSSRSMAAHRVEVTAAATAFAASSHPLDELFTVNFNEKVWLGLPPPLMFAENVAQLQAALARAPAIGMTALYDALVAALDHLQRGSRDRKVLIVVSDGGDNASRDTLDRALERARRANAPVYTVILASPDDPDAKPHVLKRLARDTGGKAYAPHSDQEMLAAFAQIAREIRSGYTIGFSPPASAGDEFRSVRVIADAGDGRKLIARTRAGYDAGPANRSAK